MTLRKKYIILILLLTLIFSTLFIFHRQKASNTSQIKNTLRTTLNVDPDNLDPRRADSASAILVECQLYEGLISLNEQNDIIPCEAKSWEVSDDKLHYTFHLHSNLKWSNGEPLTAYDYEQTWKSTLAANFASPAAWILFCLKNAQEYHQGIADIDTVGVQAQDEDTLLVTITHPAPYFLSMLAHPVFFPFYQAHKKAGDSIKNTAPVSNGAFRLADWQRKSKITLQKNTAYRTANDIKLDSIEFIMSENPLTAVTMFANGYVDVFFPPASETARLQKENALHFFPLLGTVFISVNVTAPPLDSIQVRKALALALNRRLLVDKVVRSNNEIALAFVPPGEPGSGQGNNDFRLESGNLLQDNNIDKARQLLADAGYPNGSNFPAITLSFYGNDANRSLCEALQSMWKNALNINIVLQSQEWKTWSNSMQNGSFMLALDINIGYYHDAMTFLELYDTSLNSNHSLWSNNRYNKLLSLARSSLDQQQRFTDMKEAESILIGEETALIPIHYHIRTNAVQPNLKGVVRPSIGYVYYKNAYFSD